jgi:hypothetical protein
MIVDRKLGNNLASVQSSDCSVKYQSSTGVSDNTTDMKIGSKLSKQCKTLNSKEVRSLSDNSIKDTECLPGPSNIDSRTNILSKTENHRQRHDWKNKLIANQVVVTLVQDVR